MPQPYTLMRVVSACFALHTNVCRNALVCFFPTHHPLFARGSICLHTVSYAVRTCAYHGAYAAFYLLHVLSYTLRCHLLFRSDRYSWYSLPQYVKRMVLVYSGAARTSARLVCALYHSGPYTFGMYLCSFLPAKFTYCILCSTCMCLCSFLPATCAQLYAQAAVPFR